MSAPYSKRRFLTDLLFVGGVIAVSAGLAAFGMGAFAASEPAAAAATSTPEIVVATPVECSTPLQPPQQMNPAGAPPPPRHHITSGKVAPAHPSQRPAPQRSMPGDAVGPSTR
jgi:hypothetical protein